MAIGCDIFNDSKKKLEAGEGRGWVVYLTNYSGFLHISIVL